MMKHKDKVKLARKMRTPLEISKTARNEDGTPTHEGIFTSEAWETRKIGIASRVARKRALAHERAAIRKAAVGQKPLPRWRQKLAAMRAERIAKRAGRHAAYARRNAPSLV